MYIIIPSYPSIYFALNQFYLGKDVTVITNNISVKKVLEKLEIKCVFINFKLNYKNIFQSRIKLTKLVNSLDLNKDLYLLDNVHSIEGFFLSKNWTKGKVYYKNLSTEYSIFNNVLNIKYKIIQFLCKTVLKLNLIFRNQNDIPAIGIDKSFLVNNKIKPLILENYNRIKLDVLKNLSFEGKEYNSILILQGKLEGIVEINSLKLVFNEITKLKSLVIKEHPKHKTDELFSIDNTPTIPDYFPVEMCYGNINNNIISVFSLSLVIASKMRGRKAISLLEIVDWYNVDYKKQVKNMLINKSLNRIIFPKTILELQKELNIVG